MAQWERAGPITQRSMDRNHPLLLSFVIELYGIKIDLKCGGDIKILTYMCVPWWAL